MHECLLDAIGNTPLVRIDFETPPRIYAKLEYLNPSGSIKDRSAKYMIEEAERKGLLKPGGTVIEASSGNQGIATAMVGLLKGYRVIITVSEKVSEEKRSALRAYGVEVITCKATTLLTDPESYHSVALRLAQQIPNSYFLNQYFNPDNSQAHYKGLGPELWAQTQGRITHLVGGTGSGGTVSGAGRFLKEQSSAVHVIGVDAACSYRTLCGNPQPYKLEGLGIDFDAPLVDTQVIDTFLPVQDEDALTMLRRLAHTHGLLVGPASGAVAYAVKEYSRNLTADDVVVMIFGDSGRAYLSKNFYTSPNEAIPELSPILLAPTNATEPRV